MKRSRIRRKRKAKRHGPMNRKKTSSSYFSLNDDAFGVSTTPLTSSVLSMNGSSFRSRQMWRRLSQTYVFAIAVRIASTISSAQRALLVVTAFRRPSTPHSRSVSSVLFAPSSGSRSLRRGFDIKQAKTFAENQLWRFLSKTSIQRDSASIRIDIASPSLLRAASRRERLVVTLFFSVNWSASAKPPSIANPPLRHCRVFKHLL